MSADRNLLFGILAVQLDFVSQDELMAGMNAWLLDKAKPLGEVLRDLGHLPPARLQLLDALVAEHLKKHGDDPQRSLAVLPAVAPALRRSLATVADAELTGSLGHTGGESRDPRATVDEPVRPAGRYDILRRHASGGLGDVFVAEDTELHRTVALKEIQARHADDPTRRARFVLEAEITGGLEHPGVVPVYGLGHSGDGRPYYAMRFVQGDNLLQALRRFHDPASGGGHAPGALPDRGVDAPRSPDFASLEFRDLLQRFVGVCNAVAYAHSRGVLHRDLKPGNVMLGQFGETLLVDWGLAKVTGRAESGAGEPPLRPHSGTDSSATLAGQALGTPAYMSPEQAAGRLDELGPATDVYGLGATLYELLAGRPPFGLADFDAVRAGQFPPPRAVQPAVPPALCAVCRKAMAPEPAGRYASAADLARDVERFLADEPVTAHREPAGAQARRWVRRHARLTTSVAAALAVGAAALGGLAWQREQARQTLALGQAETAKERDDKEAARAVAVAALARVERANALLGSVFEDLDPNKAQDGAKPLRAVLGERLDKATTEIEADAGGDPLAVARMQMTLGQSQRGLGYPEKAIRLFAKARATYAARFGPDHPDTLDSIANLATSYRDAGQPDAALALHEEALRLTRGRFGPDHLDVAQAANNLATVYHDAGKLDLALPLYEEAVRIRKAKLGPDHPDTLIFLNNLAAAYHATGRIDSALATYEDVWRLMKAKLGPDHPDTLVGLNNLAAGYLAAGKLDLALPLLEESLRLKAAKLGLDHPETLAGMNNLAAGYWTARRFERALALFEEALRLRRARLGPDHPDTLASMTGLGSTYVYLGKPDLAVPLLEEALRLRRTKLGPDHPDTLVAITNLALAHRAAGRHGAAEPLFREAADAARRKSGDGSPPHATALANLGLNLLVQKKWADAESALRDCLTIRAKAEPDAWTTFDTQSQLGDALLGRQKFADAEPLLLAGYAGLKQRADKIPKAGKPRLAEAAERLVRLYAALGKPDEAAKWLDEMWVWADAPAPAKP